MPRGKDGEVEWGIRDTGEVGGRGNLFFLSWRVGAGAGVIASAINVAAVKALVKTMAGHAWWSGSAWRW